MKSLIMGVHYVKQLCHWLVGKGKAKTGDKIVPESEADFEKILTTKRWYFVGEISKDELFSFKEKRQHYLKGSAFSVLMPHHHN